MATTSATAETPPAEAETGRYAKWAIALFFAVLFIPGSFFIGVRMTPYRLYLILMAVPLMLRFREDATLRITSVDVLIFLAILWRSLSILVVHGPSQIPNAGSSFLELFFGYMLGRVFIRTPADYRFFFKCFLVTLLAFLPFALLELTTKQRVMRNIFGVILDNPPTVVRDQIRFGLMRVMVSFDHAIQFGYFCAIGFVNMYFLYYDRTLRKYLLMAFTAAMTMFTLSSGPFLLLGLQTFLILYGRVMNFMTGKWLLLAGAVIVAWFSFELVVSKSVPEFIADELVYNEYGGNARIDQVEFGLREVYASPIFGIGLDTYAHPFWRSPSIDNFYLAMAIRSGVPSVILFCAAVAMIFVLSGIHRIEDQDVRNIRTGYLIGLFCQSLALYVTFIWGVGNAFFMLYIGAGCWFFNGAWVDKAPAPVRVAARPRGDRAAAPAGRPAPRPSRAAPSRPGVASSGRAGVRGSTGRIQ